MDIIPKDKMLKFHQNTKHDVRKMFDLNEGKINESLDLLQDWLAKQHHFVKKDFDREYLERMLISAKGSVERTKERIDKSCTLKSLLPHFFEDRDIKEMTKDCVGKIEPAFLPRMSDGNVRYYAVTHHGDKYTSEIILNALKCIVMQLEYARAYDYACSYEVILDYRFCNVRDIVSAVSLIDLRDLATIGIEGYGLRIKGIHILSESGFIDILMSIAKQIVPKKLSGRIQLHKNLESLHQMVQKDVLPVDLGGPRKKVADLFAEWVDILNTEEFRQYWREMSAAKTDESVRRSDSYNDQYLGMPGSFRMLTVD